MGRRDLVGSQVKRPILTPEQVSEMTEWATDRRMDSPRMAGSVVALAEQIHDLCEEIKDLRRQIAEIDHESVRTTTDEVER